MAHKDRAHAALSASGSKRWMACTPSAKLEALFPEIASTYAEEGTRAHEIAEKAILARLEARGDLVLEDPDDQRIKGEVAPYVDYVISLYEKLKKEESDTVLFLETRVDFSNYVPAGFGTADTIIMSGDTLYLIDLKFGAGVIVEAEDNPQLELYSLGAINEFGDLYDFEKVIMQICQPRTSGKMVSEQTKTVDQLKVWGKEVVRPKAAEAFAGSGTYVPGEHCRFCKAAAVCKARLKKYSAITALQDMKPKELAGNGSLAMVIREKENIERWLKDVAAFALSEMKSGVKIDGLKLVAGRSSTTCKDDEALVKRLHDEGIEDALIWKPKELLSRTELKKIVDKDIWKSIEKDLYETTQGAPKIDKAESKKKEWVAQETNDFEGVDLEAF